MTQSSDSTTRRSQLSATKQALLAQRLKKKAKNSDVPEIPRYPQTDTVPLSFAQQRMWFLEQLEPGTPTYGNPGAVHLKGHLNIAALEQSLNTVIERHATLRTTFTSIDGQPIQIIKPKLTIRLPPLDLQMLPIEERLLEALRLAREEAQRPFDLVQGPLIRVALLRLDPQEYVLLINMHHIISDEWSHGILMQEIVTLYTAQVTGQAIQLPELPIQYTDFVCWQRQWLQGEVLETQLAYWRQQLDGSPVQLQLSTDRPRPAVRSYQGARHRLEIPADLVTALQNLSKETGATVFMTLLAAFQTLLYRYTGQSDISVGSPIANRNRREVESLIGCFVNTLVLRTQLSGDLSFRDLLNRVREIALGAYAHQDLPFEKLVDALQIPRDISSSPLFQVMLVLQNTPMPKWELPDLNLSPLPVDSGTAKFDLTLHLWEQPNGLSGFLEYNTDLFEEATIARMAQHLRTLLGGIVTNPEQRLADLPLLAPFEVHQLLVDWNATQIDKFQEDCLHRLIAHQVDRAPNVVAVVFEGAKLTYQELDWRANQLAHYLQSLGVRPDQVVGLYLDRSLEMMIGLLGVLKAGTAYLPLDPKYPQERLAYILQDSQALVVLTQQHLSAQLPSTQAQVILVNTDWSVISQAPTTPPQSTVTLDNLAYVIYTSGSTGQPKGVAVTHRALVNSLQATAQLTEFTNKDVVLSVTTPSFDLAVPELFLSLLKGSRLVFANQDILTDGHQLAAQLDETGATIFVATPATWRLLVAAGWTGKPNLRMLCAGEALPRDLAHQLLARGAELWNFYGPTEATIWCTGTQIREEEGLVPIGKPIANTSIYIVDQFFNPAPIGVIGELCIGGVGLARGYLNRPTLTAEKFIPHLFSNQPGARLYRTGDLARYRPDGQIEYLGRLDHQVKVRGFRIELEEIEAVLSQHPAVQAVVVTDREDRTSEKQLVAYLILHSGTVPTVGELRQFLGEKLPPYMIPHAFVVLDTFPLSPNGKVDRRALPAPDKKNLNTASTFVAPRTPNEKLLAALWAETLGLDRLSIYSNFFELGGDSLLGMQVLAKAGQAGLRLTPKHLLERQTIAELAPVADSSQRVQADQGIVTGPVPLTPIQRWLFELNLPEPHHWNHAILFEVSQSLDPVLLEQAIGHLLAHHDALRLRFILTEAGWQQHNAGLSPVVPFTYVDLTTVPVADHQQIIETKSTEIQTSLNLATGPITKFALFERGNQLPQRLLMVVHHLVIDGISWPILLQNLQKAYQQLSSGEPLQLPPKTTPFQKWAEHLAIYAQSAELCQELDYWLANSRREVVPFPVDYPEGKNIEASARTLRLSLGKAETQSLLKDLPRLYGTAPRDAMLAALLEVVEPLMGSRSLLIDVEDHGREDLFDDVDFTRTIGWFTSIFPVLLDTSDAKTPVEALMSVKEQLGRVPKRGIGYGLLRYLSKDATIIGQLRRLPQAAVSFNYLGQYDRVLPQSTWFSLTHEPHGPDRSPLGTRRYVLDVNGGVANGQLELFWYYSEALHRRDTVEVIARRFLAALTNLVATV